MSHLPIKTAKFSTALFSTSVRLAYVISLVFCVAVLAVFIWRGNWLQTDLQALLPKDQQWQAVQQQVDKQQEQQLNRKIIALVGSPQAHQALQLSQQIAQRWRESGLFSQVASEFQPDLNQLREGVKALAFATLPVDIRTQLIQQPHQYFQQYAEQISNPFAAQSLLPLDQDWLGFGRFTLAQAQSQSNVQWQAESGALTVNEQGKTWVLLQGELAPKNWLTPPLALQQLIAQNQHLVQEQGAEMAITGASLFALQAKQGAERESQLMSGFGIGLTLILLLMVFRSLRVLWLFFPISAGVLVGLVVTLAWFGQVHILTLVIGTSLIGVLIDFPLHWLSGSLLSRRWQAQPAMQKLRLTFSVSLLVTLLGYGLLGFTTLPVLQQTALFSAAALLAAVLCTQLLLPYFFRHYQTKRPTNLLYAFYKVRCFLQKFFVYRKALIAMLILFVAGGITQSKWQDDIRQWVALSPNLVSQAQRIGELTGMQLSGQYFLVLAENDEKLLEKLTALDIRLKQAKQQQQLDSYQSLSQWLMSEKQQHNFAQQLQNLSEQDFAPLTAMGITSEIVQQQLNALITQPAVSLQAALKNPLGQGWQSLYLGQINGQRTAIVPVNGGVHQALSQLANDQDIFWQDKRSHLNESFQQTRNQAAWLKLLSFALAGLLLWRYFGAKTSGKMLFVPVCAVLATLGIFGWLGLPISLFAIFGMLLVSAIAVDYVAYLQAVSALTAHKQFAILLAASTTLISFGLLTLSSTPAVALFGLSVSIGVICAVGIAFIMYRK
ncbi:MMPL family transporter [Avibacterium endocarditidis]|uniref:MMPL family transporter n=1 Tax=Avibacterium endocarditidis TaxID=380674 RepID=UPI0039EF394C